MVYVANTVTTYKSCRVKKVRIAADAIDRKRTRVQASDQPEDVGNEVAQGRAVLMREQEEAQPATLKREGYRVESASGAVALMSTFRGSRPQVLRLECYQRLLVGRYDQCDYVLPELSVSSIHFVLFAYRTDSGEIFVSCEDKSTNGLICNGTRVHKTSILLSDGDRIEVPGSQSFLFNQFAGYTKDTDGRCEMVSTYAISDRILGTGSFGKVYLAYDKRSRRQVACKVQSKAVGDEKATGMDLKWEIDILKWISHPNINALYDVHDDGANIRLFLQLVSGGDLFEFIVRERYLQDDVAKFIVYQLGVALSYLHKHGIAHRDIKPENVLLVRGSSVMPHVLLGDFGLAFDAAERYARDQEAVVDESDGGNDTGGSADDVDVIGEVWSAKTKSHVGTPSYLAREALLSRYTGDFYDPFKMDSWSLGVMLFFMLHGMHPFDYGSAEPMIVTKSLVERQLILDGDIEPGPGCDLAAISAKQASHPSAPLVQRILRVELFWPFAGSERIAEAAQDLIVELLDAVPEQRRAVTSLFDAVWIAGDIEALKKAYDVIVLGL